VDGRSDNALDVGTIPRDRKHVEAVRYTRKLGSSDTAVGNESSRLHGLSAGYDKHLSTRSEISFCEELVVRVISLLGSIANAPIIRNTTTLPEVVAQDENDRAKATTSDRTDSEILQTYLLESVVRREILPGMRPCLPNQPKSSSPVVAYELPTSIHCIVRHTRPTTSPPPPWRSPLHTVTLRHPKPLSFKN
jgi:hypothetical protein